MCFACGSDRPTIQAYRFGIRHASEMNRKAELTAAENLMTSTLTQARLAESALDAADADVQPRVPMQVRSPGAAWSSTPAAGEVATEKMGEDQARSAS